MTSESLCLPLPLAAHTFCWPAKRCLVKATSAGELISPFPLGLVAGSAPAAALLHAAARLLTRARNRREMYFVVYGTCDVENEDGRAKIDGGMLSTIEAGSFFGELALIVDIRRTTTVRATTVCDINILTRANLIEALAGFPEAREIALSGLPINLLGCSACSSPWRENADGLAERVRPQRLCLRALVRAPANINSASLLSSL